MKPSTHIGLDSQSVQSIWETQVQHPKCICSCIVHKRDDEICLWVPCPRQCTNVVEAKGEYLSKQGPRADEGLKGELYMDT